MKPSLLFTTLTLTKMVNSILSSLMKQESYRDYKRA